MNASAAPKVRTAALTFIFITVVLDVLALGVIVPVLPGLISGLQGDDPAAAAVTFGWFVTAWEAMQFLFSPILGSLSDRFGRRPIVLLSNLGLGLDYVLMALAHTLPLLFIGRLVSGITSSTFSVAGAYIADVTPPEKRAAGFGMIGAAFGVGFIVGPALGGVLGDVDLRLPFWVAAGLSLANATYGFFVLPESLPKERREPFAWKSLNPFRTLVILGTTRRLLGVSLATFVANIAQFVYQTVFVLYMAHRYGASPLGVGIALAVVGLLSAVVQGLLVQKIVDRIGERRTLLGGMVFGIIGLVAFGAAPTLLLFSLAMPLDAMWGLANPAVQSIMTREIGPEKQGQLQGALSSSMALAGIFSPTLFTRIYAWGIRGEKLVGAPFYLASALLVVAGVMMVFATRGVVAPAPAKTAA
ncbi:TCR/Tet family MFS transporter [soil metagenome]